MCIKRISFKTFETSLMTLLAWEKLKLDLTFIVEQYCQSFGCMVHKHNSPPNAHTHTLVHHNEMWTDRMRMRMCVHAKRWQKYGCLKNKKKCRHSRMHWHMQIIVCTQTSLTIVGAFWLLWYSQCVEHYKVSLQVWGPYACIGASMFSP